MNSFPKNRLKPAAVYRPWLHGLAVLTAVLTFPLLLSGGSVTVYRVGMAVPDWPTTFGVNMFLFNMLESSWGVQLEHSHRLLGTLVGLSCIAVFLGFLLFEPRRWLKWLALVMLVSVCVQGVLGGVRVLQVSTDLAFFHGCTAGLLFSFMVAFCVWCGVDWARAPEPLADASKLRRRSMVTLIMVFAQLVLGAWVRHYGDWRGVIVHAVFAMAVWGHALALGIRVLKQRMRVPSLVPSAWAMLATVNLQLLLGVLSWWLLRPFDGVARQVWPAQAAIRVAHQGLGALLLAAAIVLTLRAYRHLSSFSSSPVGQMPGSPLAVDEPVEAVA